MNINFNTNIFCVITGASRGIGRQIAEEFARRAPQITFVLIARSHLDLTAVKAAITQINNKAIINCFALDLATCDNDTFRHALNGYNTHETAVIFHNAGQIGTIDRVAKLDQNEMWKNYYNLNMFSVAVLNACFMQIVRDSTSVIVVNVTSLVGRQPFKYLSMYGSAKAARDLYFKVLAVEEPGVKVLNYSPGMVETAMVDELVQNIEKYGDSEISGDASKLTPEQTVLKLIALLEKGEFESGNIIDYYDLP